MFRDFRASELENSNLKEKGVRHYPVWNKTVHVKRRWRREDWVKGPNEGLARTKRDMNENGTYQYASNKHQNDYLFLFFIYFL